MKCPETGLLPRARRPWDCAVGLPLHITSAEMKTVANTRPLPSLLHSPYFHYRRPRQGTSTLTDLQIPEGGRLPEASPRLDKKRLGLQEYILQCKQTYISFAHNSPIWNYFALSSYFSPTRAYLNSTS